MGPPAFTEPVAATTLAATEAFTEPVAATKLAATEPAAAEVVLTAELAAGLVARLAEPEASPQAVGLEASEVLRPAESKSARLLALEAARLERWWMVWCGSGGEEDRTGGTDVSGGGDERRSDSSTGGSGGGGGEQMSIPDTNAYSKVRLVL